MLIMKQQRKLEQMQTDDGAPVVIPQFMQPAPEPVTTPVQHGMISKCRSCLECESIGAPRSMMECTCDPLKYGLFGEEGQDESRDNNLPFFMNKPEIIKMHLEILYKSISFLSEAKINSMITTYKLNKQQKKREEQERVLMHNQLKKGRGRIVSATSLSPSTMKNIPTLVRKPIPVLVRQSEGQILEPATDKSMMKCDSQISIRGMPRQPTHLSES